jgi:dihydroorotase
MVARAQYQGLPVSADVCAHQLHLTESSISDFDSLYHVDPPLRTQHDREGLCKGVADAVISAICSDHQPHEPDAKLAPFPATEPGISGLETLLPLTLQLVEQKIITLNQAIARLTHGPATILGIEAGTLQPGSSADICIFDPETPWQLQQEQMVSQGHNSPFIGSTFNGGRVMYTLLEGNIVFNRKG